MNLYIRIRDGQPYEHPILEENFREAFPSVDVNNLPFEFARFERIPCPEAAGVYELDQVTYQWVDGVVKDVWSVRQMTNEEKTRKQNEVKAAWQENPGWTSWIFDEDVCFFKPPIPYPTDRKLYRWDEPTVSWVEITTEYA